VKRFSGYVFLAAVCLSNVCGAAPFIIDGDFSDWAGVAPFTRGLLSESVGDAHSAPNDLETVWVAGNEDGLYISVQCRDAVKGGAWSPTLVAIDSDLNASTGFPCGPLGVDYLIQPEPDLGGNLLIHKRIQGANDTVWSRWDPPIVERNAFAAGSGDSARRVETRIPWKDLGVEDPGSVALRFCVCDGAPLLSRAEGDWAPDCRLAYLSLGKDPRAMDSAKDLCLNGSFEQLQEAAANPLPQNWTPVARGPSARIEISEDAAREKRSLRLSARAEDVAGMNGAVMALSHGYVRFQYKILESSVEGANLALYAIGLAGPSGAEIVRQGLTPPKEHVGDGHWHEAGFEFDFSARGAAHCITEAASCRPAADIAPRVNENASRSGFGDWLIDAVEVYAVQSGPQLKVAQVWADKPLARTGESITFSAFVENNGDEAARGVTIRLNVMAGLSTDQPTRTIPSLAPGDYERLDWKLAADSPGEAGIEVVARAEGPGLGDAATFKLLAIDSKAQYSRQELCTDATGYWRLLTKPTTLQEGNAAPLAPIRHKTSAEIKHNTYGICAHLPRSKDYEDPFDPTHLIDDDPEACWSSQQRPSSYPGDAPWAEVDLGRNVNIHQINLIPYWRNTDFPNGFSVRASLDGANWDTVLRVKNHRMDERGPLRGDKTAQCFAFAEPRMARYVRVDFERLPLSGGNYAEVSQGYKARLSGIEIIDGEGRNAALKELGATVRVSDVFTGWQNTVKTVNESFHRIMDIGFKWVRVGQWGDQTEWAAIEREKGVYAMDPVTDAAIDELCRNGVDILYGLNYGNALHEAPEKPWGDIGPIYTEGHPFYKNGGPKTEAGREAFVRYVDFVVRKYKARINWYELWNEENGWYPGHEPELYGKLLYAVARHIKSIDPQLKVMYGGTAAPAPITTEIALREGAAPYVDAYAFHPYGIDKPEGGMGTMESHQGKNLGQSREQTGWNRLEDILEGVKKPFAQHGRPAVAVWMNEWGTNVAGLDFTYKPGIGEFGCAKYMMRFYVYSGWLGVPAAWWALYNENKSQDWGIVDQHDYGLRPMSYAVQNVCSVVSDVEPLRPFDASYEGPAPDPKIIAFRRDGSDETLVLVWAAEPSNEDIKSYPGKLIFARSTAPKRVTITDLYWGVSQEAQWTYEGQSVAVDHLLVRDYPLVLSCE